MGFSRFFIDRPIFAAVLSIVITIFGLVTITRLPLSEYPEVTPPTISVTAAYPGASPETIAETVATPIEQAINGVENMHYLASDSTADGRLRIVVTFRLGTDLDTAQVLVQNRIATVEPRLPQEVQRLGVNVAKNSPDLMMVVHTISPDDARSDLHLELHHAARAR